MAHLGFSPVAQHGFNAPLHVGTSIASGGAETVALVERCACGNVFMHDAVFCRKCGLKRPAAKLVTPIQDAESSVDFLCRKFEALSEQLRREETAREIEKHRGQRLVWEGESAEEAATRRRDDFAMELSASSTSLVALRASGAGAGRLAETHANRIRMEHAASAHQEQMCVALAHECQAKSLETNQARAKAAVHEKDAAQERQTQHELSRRLHFVQGDARSVLDDLHLAQQRMLLLRGEQKTLERDLGAASKLRNEAFLDSEILENQLREKDTLAKNQDSRIHALAEDMEGARSKNRCHERRLGVVCEEDATMQAHLASLQEELAITQQLVEGTVCELQDELGIARALNQELRAVDTQKVACAEELAAFRRSMIKAEMKLQGFKQQVPEINRARDRLGSQAGILASEEQQHAAAASCFRRARHTGEVVFEDVHCELQTAFKKQEALEEDFALQCRACDTLRARAGRFKPEIAEADERCRHLEQQLAVRSREMEAELVQHRDAKQEIAYLSESLRRMDRFEAELRVAQVKSNASDGSSWREQPLAHNDSVAAPGIHAPPIWVAAEICSCGNRFLPDSIYCRKCGKKRGREVLNASGLLSPKER